MRVGRICKRRVHRENSFCISSFVRTIGTQSHQTHIVKIYLAWAIIKIAGKSIITKHFKSSFAIVEQAHFTFWSLSMKLKQKYFCFNHSSFYYRITGLKIFSPSRNVLKYSLFTLFYLSTSWVFNVRLLLKIAGLPECSHSSTSGLTHLAHLCCFHCRPSHHSGIILSLCVSYCWLRYLFVFALPIFRQHLSTNACWVFTSLFTVSSLLHGSCYCFFGQDLTSLAAWQSEWVANVFIAPLDLQFVHISKLFDANHFYHLHMFAFWIAPQSRFH